jgi:hypothetical protein
MYCLHAFVLVPTMHCGAEPLEPPDRAPRSVDPNHQLGKSVVLLISHLQIH